jgi:uncharacterized membrane protein YciS (DUF1049 family)
MRFISTLLVAVLSIALMALACINAEMITVNYYIGTAKMPMSMLCALVFVFGCFICLLLTLFVYLKQKKYQFSLKRRIQLLEKELANLQSSPTKD